ncbi:hypothetical protein BC827DRAFT_1252021 [Russula dissimulans]|nr:hypothetical protein BC827DRAFT_1252021 [Russula dissimulans]
MNQRFHDAMAIARFYGGFDIFITFTTNPGQELRMLFSLGRPLLIDLTSLHASLTCIRTLSSTIL